MHWPRTAMNGFLGLALLGTAAACTWQGLRPAQTGVQRLYIVGNPPHVNDREIIAATTEYLDAGFFDLDIKAVKNAVEALPWVGGARIYRRWPSGLIVQVREHEPIALWGEDAVLAADGSVFRPGAGELPDGLLKLVGPDRAREEILNKLPKLREALTPMKAELARVQLSARGSWTVTLSDGLELRLGRSQIIKRAARFAVYGPPAVGDALANADYVDLRYDNGFAVGGVRSARDTRGKRG